MPAVTARSFTARYDGIVNVLRSPVLVFPAFDPKYTPEPKRPDGREYMAIWDTGATGSAITERVAQECGLQPISMTKVHTAHGEGTSHVYLVNFMLPNQVGVAQVRVTEGILRDADVLLGMDIIGRGDFAITNLNGKTTFSFRYPSMDCIDFVEQPPPKQEPYRRDSPKVGRNDPCPCGSGKKFKKCCGR